jgi:hypothetical protein
MTYVPDPEVPEAPEAVVEEFDAEPIEKLPLVANTWLMFLYKG